MLQRTVTAISALCVMVVKHIDEGVAFLGSGFVAHSSGHVLTCAHFLNPLDRISVVNFGAPIGFVPVQHPQVNLISARIVQIDSQADVALLKIVENVQATPPPNFLGDTNRLNVGTSVACFGFPFGHVGLHNLSTFSAVISSKVLSTSNIRQLQFDTMIHEGNSGGPLVTSSGQVMGVVSGKFNPLPGGGGIRIGTRSLGTDTNISYASDISYGISLMQQEGLNV